MLHHVAEGEALVRAEAGSAAAKACRRGGASAYARKTTPPARASRCPRSLGLAVHLALIRVGSGVGRCVSGETLRTRMGTPAARFSTSPGDRDGRAAGCQHRAAAPTGLRRKGSHVFDQRHPHARRPRQVRGAARCGQAAASVLKNRLQASPSAEVPLSSQAPRITSLSNRSLTGLRITRTGAAIVRHAPEGGFSGRSPRRRAPDLPRPTSRVLTAAAKQIRWELGVGVWELAFGV